MQSKAMQYCPPSKCQAKQRNGKTNLKAKQRKTQQSNTNANESRHQNKALQLSKGKTPNRSRAGIMFYSKKWRERVFRVDGSDVTLTVPAACTQK